MISAQEHDTPSFAAWHKVLEGFGDDLLSAYPPECKVIDEFFIKTTAGKPNGQDAVLAGLVFETSGLKAVKKFLGEGKNEIFQQGRRDGWLTGKWRENYFACADFRGPTPGPPPQFQKGWGICFGAHGLGVPYKDWLKVFGSPDVDALHESLNIQYSVCGPINGKVSTDLSGGGVGVLHVTKSFKDTARFDAVSLRRLPMVFHFARVAAMASVPRRPSTRSSPRSRPTASTRSRAASSTARS